jgi:hypothetical protein
MNEPTWKLLPLRPLQQIQVVFREWPDGKQESCLVTEPAYLKWLEEGNTPEPADEQ